MAGQLFSGGGLLGAQAALEDLIAERKLAELQKAAALNQQMEMELKQRAAGQADRRIDIDQGRLGFDAEKFAAEEPTRQAGVLKTRAETAALERKPIEEADARAHRYLEQELAQGNEMARIRARGNEELRVAQTRPRDERTVQIMGPNGVPMWERESAAIGKPAAQAPRAVTGQERTVMGFYNRAKQASDDIGSMEEQMAKAGMGSQLQQQYAPNMLQTEMQQRYRQAQRAFTEARLRKESGAAIPTPEYENDARTYFAQPGDSPQVIQQKRQAREVVLKGLKFASGKAYDEFYGGDTGTPMESQVFDWADGKLVPRGGR